MFEQALRLARPAALSVAAAALCAAASAQASVTATLVQNSVQINSGGEVTGFDPAELGGNRIDVSGGIGPPGGRPVAGLTVDALSDLDATAITFKNGVIGSGINASATIGVDITFTNTYSFAFRPVLVSTLLAAGIGMTATNFQNYRDNPDATTTASCVLTQLKNCGALAPATQSQINQDGRFLFGPSSTGFDFDVSVGGASVYNLNGKLSLEDDGFVEYFNGADSILNNFARVENENGVAAYSWDDTVVEIGLPDLLQPGESVTARYTITTWIDTTTGTFDLSATDPDNGIVKILGFSAFGDPTGGKDPVNNASPFYAMADETGVPRLTTNGFTRFLLPSETVDEANQTVSASFMGTTSFVARDEFPYGDPNAAVPEPATWAMMISGFGLVGGSLRRRRPARALTA